MRQLNEKVILTDCDGVLLDWEYHFYKWLKETEGYEKIHDYYDISKAIGVERHVGSKFVNTFNTSEYMKTLSPLRDSIKYVRKLYEEHGYLFHVITSQTNDKIAQDYRKENLKNVFGDVFDGFTILGTGWDKTYALKEWEGTECWWIEDKAANIEMGNQVGLRGILINHAWNKTTNYECSRVTKWKEIYEIITGEM
jgi:FMN phosphatase YigB (HAD superfamily)|tara:strand:- start:2012 stop:2599 length:588 start_codon:yes stop_codon:yes gene_type:complete